MKHNDPKNDEIDYRKRNCDVLCLHESKLIPKAGFLKLPDVSPSRRDHDHVTQASSLTRIAGFRPALCILEVTSLSR
jgi:hypothetical protein